MNAHRRHRHRSRSTAEPRAGDVQRFAGRHHARRRTLLGYTPIVGLEEGLRHTLDWCRAEAPLTASRLTPRLDRLWPDLPLMDQTVAVDPSEPYRGRVFRPAPAFRPSSEDPMVRRLLRYEDTTVYRESVSPRTSWYS